MKRTKDHETEVRAHFLLGCSHFGRSPFRSSTSSALSQLRFYRSWSSLTKLLLVLQKAEKLGGAPRRSPPSGAVEVSQGEPGDPWGAPRVIPSPVSHQRVLPKERRRDAAACRLFSHFRPH